MLTKLFCKFINGSMQIWHADSNSFCCHLMSDTDTEIVQIPG